MMKLICLNTWGGKLFEPLMQFIEREAVDTDIFCFQEVFDTDHDPPPTLRRGARADIYKKIAQTPPDFTGYFALSEKSVDFDGPLDVPADLGLATFVRKGIPVDSVENRHIRAAEMLTGLRTYTAVRNLQYLRIGGTSAPVIIANFHGLLDEGHKWDTAARIEQFTLVNHVFAQLPYPKVFCGDLNAYPDTESIRMFEEAGMRDLIKDFKVPTTRNDNYVGVKEFGDYTSDYMFVSPDLNVTRFEALLDEVSDHLALVLEWK